MADPTHYFFIFYLAIDHEIIFFILALRHEIMPPPSAETPITTTRELTIEQYIYKDNESSRR